MPQRVILLQESTTSPYQRYVEKELLKTLEQMDAGLLIRFMKEAEYTTFIDYLYDATADGRQLAGAKSLKEFYLKTGVRGIIYTKTTVHEGRVTVLVTLYQIYSEKIDIKELQFSETSFFEKISNFSNLMDSAVREAFPPVEISRIKKDRIRILTVVRDAPDFRLSLAAKSGYMGRYFSFEDTNTSSDQISELMNGPLVGVMLSSKIRSFYLDTTIEFVPYITLNSTNQYIKDRFWFSANASLFAGGYLVGDLIAIGVGIVTCVESVGGSFYQWPVHIRLIPAINLVINPVKKIRFGARFGPSILLNKFETFRVDVPGFMINMFLNIDINEHLFILVDMFSDVSADGIRVKDTTNSIEYKTSYMINRLVIGFGYRWNWRKEEKK